MPAALEGDQYELWDTDDQPIASDLVAAEPKFVTVICSRCNTVMHPTINRVGQQITCPDCGHREVIPPPPKPQVKKNVIAADAPVLDPASAPADRPYVPMPVAGMLYDDERDQEYQRALDKAQRTGKPLEIDHRGRPIMPRYPLITGVLPFVFSRGVPLVWLAISVGYMYATYVLLQGIAISAEGYGAVSGMPLFAIGCALLMFCTAFTYSCVLQIVMESSEGNRAVHHWPGFTDWLGSLLWAGVALPFSAVPGWAVSQIPALADQPYIAAISADISALILLPIIMLSQLDINSPAGILSGRILKSLTHCPFSWMLFYLESTVLWAICGAAAYSVATYYPSFSLWLMFLYAAAVILYARLLGRLAWRLAEAMPIIEE
jgi:DNA-directed RNA polymerase subunit RPC12/RpoP